MLLHRTWYRTGAIFVAVFVLVVSSWPALTVKPFGWAFADKLEHAIVYALLAYLTVRGWLPDSPASRRRGLLVLLLGLSLFAVLDEYHQRWIPGRFVEAGDLAADAVGMCSGFLLGLWHNHRCRRRVVEG